jgi:DNA (cytosine-5)-methyltransferase 1
MHQQYPKDVNIINNPFVKKKRIDNSNLDDSKNVLVSLIPDKYIEPFTNQRAKAYFTGKKFPSTVKLNNLYYFMPYIKGKGVSDLYLIRVARVGTKAEVHPETNDEKPRLVFELEYLESLPRNQWVRLDKDKDFAFKDTLLGRIFKDNQET